MRINIDTLEITGSDTNFIELVAGYNGVADIIESIAAMDAQRILKDLFDEIIEFKVHKKPTASLKRLLMVFHLFKNETRNIFTCTDILYYRDFTKGSYVWVYSNNINFKLLLGIKYNSIEVKETKVDHFIIKDELEIIPSLERLVIDTKKLNSMIQLANFSFVKTLHYIKEHY